LPPLIVRFVKDSIVNPLLMRYLHSYCIRRTRF